MSASCAASITGAAGTKSGSPTESEMTCFPSRRSAAARSVTCTVFDIARPRTRDDSAPSPALASRAAAARSVREEVGSKLFEGGGDLAELLGGGGIVRVERRRGRTVLARVRDEVEQRGEALGGDRVWLQLELREEAAGEVGDELGGGGELVVALARHPRPSDTLPPRRARGDARRGGDRPPAPARTRRATRPSRACPTPARTSGACRSHPSRRGCRSIASFAWAFTESMSTTRRPATSAGGSERSTVSNESTEVATTTTSHASAANASRVRQNSRPSPPLRPSSRSATARRRCGRGGATAARRTGRRCRSQRSRSGAAASAPGGRSVLRPRWRPRRRRRRCRRAGKQPRTSTDAQSSPRWRSALLTRSSLADASTSA